MVCPSVRGDNPQAFGEWIILRTVQVDKSWRLTCSGRADDVHEVCIESSDYFCVCNFLHFGHSVQRNSYTVS